MNDYYPGPMVATYLTNRPRRIEYIFAKNAVPSGSASSKYMYCKMKYKGGVTSYKCYTTVSDAAAETGPMSTFTELPPGALEVT